MHWKPCHKGECGRRQRTGFLGFAGIANKVGDSNELEWLDELVQEHEKGIRDNSNTLKRLILTIEREHKNTPDLTKRLERARRVLNR